MRSRVYRGGVFFARTMERPRAPDGPIMGGSRFFKLGATRLGPRLKAVSDLAFSGRNPLKISTTSVRKHQGAVYRRNLWLFGLAPCALAPCAVAPHVAAGLVRPHTRRQDLGEAFIGAAADAAKDAKERKARVCALAPRSWPGPVCGRHPGGRPKLGLSSMASQSLWCW